MASKIVAIIAVVCAYLIIAMPLGLAQSIGVNLYLPDETTKLPITVSIPTPGDLVTKTVNFLPDPTGTLQNVLVKYDIKTKDHPIKKGFVWLCKDLEPSDCLTQKKEPIAMQEFLNKERVWSDVGQVTGTYPQKGNVLILINLDVTNQGGASQSVWVGMWDEITTLGANPNQFSVKTNRVAPENIDVVLEKAEYSNLTAEFIKSFYMIPKNWVKKVSIQKVENEVVNIISGTQLDNLDSPQQFGDPHKRSAVNSIQSVNLKKQYNIEFPIASLPDKNIVASAITLFNNPKALCGEDTDKDGNPCDTNLGESEDNCPRDCGCASKGSNYTASFSQSESKDPGVCVNADEIKLTSYNLDTNLVSCEVSHDEEFTARIINAPSDLTIEEWWYNLNNKTQRSISCNKRVGSEYTCQLTIDPLDNCVGPSESFNGIHTVSNNKLFANVKYSQNSFSKELSTNLPDIHIQQKSISVDQIRETIQRDFRKINADLDHGFKQAKKFMDLCIKGLTYSMYAGLGAAAIVGFAALAEGVSAIKSWWKGPPPVPQFGAGSVLTDDQVNQWGLVKGGTTTVKDGRIIALDNNGVVKYAGSATSSAGKKITNVGTVPSAAPPSAPPSAAPPSVATSSTGTPIITKTEKANKISFADLLSFETGDQIAPLIINQIAQGAQNKALQFSQAFSSVSSSLSGVALQFCNAGSQILDIYSRMAQIQALQVKFNLCLMSFDNLMGNGACDGQKGNAASALSAANACMNQLQGCMGDLKQVQGAVQGLKTAVAADAQTATEQLPSSKAVSFWMDEVGPPRGSKDKPARVGDTCEGRQIKFGYQTSALCTDGRVTKTLKSYSVKVKVVDTQSNNIVSSVDTILRYVADYTSTQPGAAGIARNQTIIYAKKIQNSATQIKLNSNDQGIINEADNILGEIGSIANTQFKDADRLDENDVTNAANNVKLAAGTNIRSLIPGLTKNADITGSVIGNWGLAQGVSATTVFSEGGGMYSFEFTCGEQTNPATLDIRYEADCGNLQNKGLPKTGSLVQPVKPASPTPAVTGTGTATPTSTRSPSASPSGTRANVSLELYNSNLQETGHDSELVPHEYDTDGMVYAEANISSANKTTCKFEFETTKTLEEDSRTSGGGLSIVSVKYNYTTEGEKLVTVTCKDKSSGTLIGASHDTIIFDKTQPVVNNPVIQPVSGNNLSITAGYTRIETGSGIKKCQAKWMTTQANWEDLKKSNNANHTYSAAGTYDIEIQCIDNAGNIGSKSRIVTVPV